MHRKIAALFILVMMMFCQLQPQTIVWAKEGDAATRIYDTYSKEHTKSFAFTKTMISISPTTAESSVPNEIKTVSFNVNLNGSIQYDYLTNAYVSASAPKATLEYQGKVALTFESMSTSYRDNGSTITFSFTGKLKGTATSNMGVVCSMDYGTVSGSFTVNK
ncbi:hypothetical protein J6K35_04605 [bacterium]|nr:hypothetical protein [Lachnospiraceae bacterium]MBP3491126.1 hypothetical protein [bacterium]